nr:MAG TPA: hypothetical protein [Caudoviricetes sp.]
MNTSQKDVREYIFIISSLTGFYIVEVYKNGK